MPTCGRLSVKLWIVPILVGLVLGVAVLVFLPHHGGLQLHALILKKGAPALPASGPTIGPETKIGAVAAGIILAFIPVDAVKQIGVALATAGITTLLG
jgi:hypothetical protein